MDIIQLLAQELDKQPQHVENVVRLLDEGNTIPFIARYRKEQHGAMDDGKLRTLEERLGYLRNLAKRREAVKKSIEDQGKLTEELAAAIDAAQTLAELAQQQLPKLRGCDAHFTVVLSEVDEKLLKKLGIHVSCEPKYETKKLYHK